MHAGFFVCVHVCASELDKNGNQTNAEYLVSFAKRGEEEEDEKCLRYRAKGKIKSEKIEQHQNEEKWTR